MAERSKKKKTVRSISGPGFRSARDLSLKEIKKLSVPSFDRVVEHLLPDLGWKGDLYGSVGLFLSNDNKFIVNGKFFLSGQLFPGSETKRFQAAKFWSAGTDLDLQLSILLTSHSESEIKSISREQKKGVNIFLMTVRYEVSVLKLQRARTHGQMHYTN